MCSPPVQRADTAVGEAELVTIRSLLSRPEGHVHLAGICGVGMAGLAALLKARGLTVTGCDAYPNHLAGWLERQGIAVQTGHDAQHLSGVTWVVRSSAVPSDHPELTAALARDLPVCRRGAVLAALLAGRLSVAVCGTHGKTTTTALIIQMLRAAGRDPSYFVGGEVPTLDGVAHAGQVPIMVAEADESDGTLALYAPDVTVVTNIEFDHLEHFASIEDFEGCFRTVMQRTDRRVIVCAEDTRAMRLVADLPAVTTFGMSGRPDLCAEGVSLGEFDATFALRVQGKPAGRFHIPAPGRHNVLNALAALAVGLELGLTPEEMRRGLAEGRRPRRRFETVVNRSDVLVVSDYAHHPTEIAASVAVARRLPRRRILAIFQPHRYTRTRALGPQFPASFQGVDEIVLLPVYAAAEPPLPGGTVWDLYEHFRHQGVARVSVASSLAHAWSYCRTRLRDNDTLLLIGAGDVETIASWATQELAAAPVARLDPSPGWAQALHALGLSATTVRLQAPLARRTTLRVGGAADVWLEIGSEADVVKVVRWAHQNGVGFRVLGGGSNSLVSDLGVRGLTARLSGKCFQTLRWTDGVVAAGAGLALSRLLGWCEQHGCSGLEFLAGIPGTVGGAVCGNAGAWGSSLGEHVAWVRSLSPDAEEVLRSAKELGFAYRACEGLRGHVVLEVGLRVERASPAAIRTRRAEIAARRAWWGGLHSAGSLFKNPPDESAGRLIEACGLKGYAVGGARLSPRHANVVVTERGARASDVRAVLEKARAEVQQRFHVLLEPEVIFLE